MLDKEGKLLLDSNKVLQNMTSSTKYKTKGGDLFADSRS